MSKQEEYLKIVADSIATLEAIDVAKDKMISQLVNLLDMKATDNKWCTGWLERDLKKFGFWTPK